jgi:hypothetical protein
MNVLVRLNKWFFVGMAVLAIFAFIANNPGPIPALMFWLCFFLLMVGIEDMSLERKEPKKIIEKADVIEGHWVVVGCYEG